MAKLALTEGKDFLLLYLEFGADLVARKPTLDLDCGQKLLILLGY